MRKTSIEQQLDQLYYQELKFALEVHFQFQVNTFTDCKILSQKLAQKKVHVSAHTLARMFGIFKTKLKPYTATLNLICRFLKYDSFAAFCKIVNQETEHSLKGKFASFKTGPFSFVALELALANEDWLSMQELLEAFHDFDTKDNDDLTMKLGMYARQTNNPIYFKKLNEIHHGKLLFFQSFVDEDDPDNYYSNILKKYYNNKSNEPNERLFYNCYQASKNIYLNKAIDRQQTLFLNEMHHFLSSECHFHELSRFLEVKILVDYKNDQLKNSLYNHLENICSALNQYENLYQKTWIVARSIKALAHSKELKKALKHNDFKDVVFNLYHQGKGKIMSIADLIIQFTVHAYINTDKAQREIMAPKKLQKIYYNESNSRIALESATALIYAEGKVKNILEKNLYAFAGKSGHGWIFELLK
jgi:hypothetical protein